MNINNLNKSINLIKRKKKKEKEKRETFKKNRFEDKRKQRIVLVNTLGNIFVEIGNAYCCPIA